VLEQEQAKNCRNALALLSLIVAGVVCDGIDQGLVIVKSMVLEDPPHFDLGLRGELSCCLCPIKAAAGTSHTVFVSSQRHADSRSYFRS